MKITKPVIGLMAICSVATADVYAEDGALVTEQQKVRVEAFQTGRYSYVKNIPPVDQLNPLKVAIKTRIPQSVNTVGESIDFLLVRSGYQLADESILSYEAKELMKLPLPEIHRKIGPMTLDRALQTLSGEAFALVVDPVHRIVSFELSTKIARAE